MTILKQIGESKKSKRNSNTGSIKQLPSGNWGIRWYPWTSHWDRPSGSSSGTWNLAWNFGRYNAAISGFDD